MKTLDVLTILRAPLERYPPSVNQVSLLARAGLQVGVVDLSGDAPAPELHPSIRRWRVHRSWNSKAEPPPPFLRRWVNWLKFAHASRSVIRGCRPRVVIAYDTLASVFVRPRPARYRTVYHFHELPEAEPAMGLGPRLALRGALRRSRHADLVVFPDRGRAEEYQRTAGLVAMPAVVMNCPARMESVPESPLSAELAQRGFLDRRVVCFVGSIGPDKGIQEAASSMQRWPDDSLLVLVGECSEATKRTILAASHSPGRVVFLGYRPYLQALALAAGSHLGIALIQATTRNWLYSAGAINKRFEYMALGLPQVTNAGPGVAELVEQTGCGICADPRSPEAIGRAVCDLLNNGDLRQRMAANSRRWHLEKFNYERQFEPVLNWIQGAVNSRSNEL